jgi:hypothetical protein
VLRFARSESDLPHVLDESRRKHLLATLPRRLEHRATPQPTASRGAKTDTAH